MTGMTTKRDAWNVSKLVWCSCRADHTQEWYDTKAAAKELGKSHYTM